MNAGSAFDAWLGGDPELAHLLGEEMERQSTTLQLIASENFTYRGYNREVPKSRRLFA